MKYTLSRGYRNSLLISTFIIAYAVLNINCVTEPFFARLSNEHMTRRTGFLLVEKSVRFIQALDKEVQNNLYFWYDKHEIYFGLYHSIASAYLWEYRLVNEEFPDLTEEELLWGFKKNGVIQMV